MCAACGRRFELKGVHVLRLAVGGTQGLYLQHRSRGVGDYQGRRVVRNQVASLRQEVGGMGMNLPKY